MQIRRVKQAFLFLEMATSSSSTTLEEFENKELLDRVRPLLQRDKIRLWEPPYTDANTGAENIPQVRTQYFLLCMAHLFELYLSRISSIVCVLNWVLLKKKFVQHYLFFVDMLWKN